ncbi:hypothetical protein L1049_009233 [Liquidambar formosana]|uniref:J domain-containing protein n=1 Tax=Liquidambar formosana TaxID=63359 RepID=A0AAP0SBW9_LIQFO
MNSEKRESSDTVGKSGSNDSGKTKIATATDCGKHENVGLVFGSSQSDLASISNSEKRESSENAGKSCSDDRVKMKIGIGAEFVKYDDQRECIGNVGSSVSDDRGKMKAETETEFQKVRTAGVTSSISGRGCSSMDGFYEEGEFVFGNSSSESSSFYKDRVTKLPEEINKLSSKTSGHCDGNTKIQNGNLGSEAGMAKTEDGNLSFDGNNKCSFVFGSSSASGTNPVFKLPDEMKKLNINDFGKSDGANKFKDFNIKSCTDAEIMFVFGSGREAACSSAGSSSATCDHVKNSNSGGCMSDDAFEKINGVNLKSSDENSFISGISSPKPYTSQAGLGKSSDLGQVPQFQVNGDSKLNEATRPSSFSSIGLGFQPNDAVFEASSLGRVEMKGDNRFTSTSDKLDASSTDFGTPKWDPPCFIANLFPGLNDFSTKRRTVHKSAKKMRGKLRQPTFPKQCPVQDLAPRESSSQENLDSPGSPMDFSPYQEIFAADQCPRENSMASSESSQVDNNCAPSTANATVSTDVKDEHVDAAGEGFDINKGDEKYREPNEHDSRYYCEKGFVADFLVEEFFKVETVRSSSITDQVCSSSGAGVAAADAGVGFSFNTQKQENNSGAEFSFASGLEDKGERNFTFSASPSAPGSLSRTKRQHRKKYRMKVGGDSFNITSGSKIEFASSSFQFSPFPSTSSHLDSMQGQKGDLSSSQSIGENKAEADEEQMKQGIISASAATQEACEKWRLRGNKAYKNGDLSKAEEFYTWGINSVPASVTSGCCLEPLVLCYSNRAVARMSLGRMREAIGDCMMAAALDPNFLKVQMRAANYHLTLGEVEDALQLFNKCLESGGVVCLDRRIIIEASDGLQKAQKVAETINRCAELLQDRTSDSAITALGLIAEALSISSHSEKLLEMKAEALCMLRKYEEAIQLCEHTLDFAEKNFSLVGASNQLASAKGHDCKNNSFFRLWRLHLISKSYFHLGRVEVALDLLEKQEQVGSITVKGKGKSLESSLHLAVTIRELLRYKNAGNEAFQSRRHAEAVEHYTAALSSSIESRPFAAICFCNRAAAHHALGQIADAIADCSLAIALNGNYPKAVSRRATFHEMIRDYGQAATDLQRLISIHEKLSHEKAKQSGRSGGPDGSIKELRNAHHRLSLMEEQAKKEIPLDLYQILGIKPSDTASEIKKAYRKAALRHHPDKAGQFLARSESGDDGQLWKEIAEEVHKDADRLFKMIGEAYAVLSDPTKRSQYDLEEEMRNALKERSKSSTARRESDVRGNPFQSGSQRHWQESWKTYGNSHSRW